jgi:predicted transcriptional regulator
MNVQPDHPADSGDEEAVEVEDEEFELEEGEVEDPTAVGESRFREAAEAAALGDIFQRVTQLLPSDQDLLRLDAGTSALDGLRELARHSYSQAPVMRADRCIGVFSYRSFARTVAAFPQGRSNVAEIAVEDCVEQLPYVRLEDNIEDIFDALDRNDAVLVGEPARLLAIVSPMDALYYLYGIANGYVLMRQIELALRHVIRISTTVETLAECIAAAVAQKYVQQRRDPPERLEDMDFSDLGSIINSGRTWPHFTAVLGQNHDLVKTRLAPLAGIRNDLFHFRRAISAEEYETLAITRNWLLLRIELAETPEASA